MRFDPFCCSSYLSYRYIVEPGRSWRDGVTPEFPVVSEKDRYEVGSAAQVLDALRALVADVVPSETGVLLSGGIDSAILAALLPRGTRAYTVRFVAEGATDESEAAARYAEHCGLNHTVVEVTWEDYRAAVPVLMQRKASPLHAVEVGLYHLARAASADGLSKLIVGNGADSTFGGLDKLLSRDWSFDAFVERYTFLDPRRALREPVLIRSPFERYRRGEGIDVNGFLKVIHGLGIVQSFENGIQAGGCAVSAPYEQLWLSEPLDIPRIRAGESKYMLREVFNQLYPHLPVAPKLAFVRPMGVWMKDWRGPSRPEFLPDLDISGFSAEQRWLTWCLEQFMNVTEGV